MVDKRRFQNLEWARPKRRQPKPEEDESAAAERIEAVECVPETPAPVAAEADGPLPTGLARERFEEPSLQLATVAPDAPLFHRCHVCGADNQRSDAICHHCNADLRTAAQEAFDAKLLEKEKAEQRREHEGEGARRRERSGTVPADQQAELGKAFAALFAEERGEGAPVAWRLFCSIPNPWRWVAAGGVVLFYLGLYRASQRTSGWIWIWLVTIFVSLVLFTPPRFWTQTVNRNRWF